MICSNPDIDPVGPGQAWFSVGWYRLRSLRAALTPSGEFLSKETVTSQSARTARKLDIVHSQEPAA